MRFKKQNLAKCRLIKIKKKSRLKRVNLRKNKSTNKRRRVKATVPLIPKSKSLKLFENFAKLIRVRNVLRKSINLRSLTQINFKNMRELWFLM